MCYIGVSNFQISSFTINFLFLFIFVYFELFFKANGYFRYFTYPIECL